LLKQAIPVNPNIIPVEEMDAAITIFTATIKSSKNASKLYLGIRLERSLTWKAHIIAM
jgi:hypothetical protein